MDFEDSELNPASRELLSAVEAQIASPETPYVAETAERLRKEVPDLEEGEEKRLIAYCLLDEMDRLIVEERGFDEKRYQNMLGLLPVMPENSR